MVGKIDISSIWEGLPKGKLIELAVIAAGFATLFLIVNYLHFQFLEVRVILYSCILDLVLATLIWFGGYLALRRPAARRVTGMELFLAVLVVNLAGVIYSIMGPTVIDRSLSLYIVEKLQQRGGEISEDAFADIFIKEYLPEFRLVDVRLTEQVTSGTVVIKDGCVRLTRKGEAIAGFTRFYRRHFLPKRRVLMGEVTDQLTDPFRNAQPKVRTDCAPGGAS